MMIDIKDDLRQSVVIAKNEITKYIRGRKLLVFIIIEVLILAVLSAIPYIFGDSYPDGMTVVTTFIAIYLLLIELSVVLFAATAIVSEFEDRTALVLFTKPVNKWAIYVGKLAASMALVFLLGMIYLVYIMVFSQLATGEVVPGFGTSFLLTLCAVFGLCGLAMMFSSFAKKGSTAIIMTLIMILLFLDLIAGLLSTFAEIPPWWCLSDAVDYVILAFGPYGGVSATSEEILRAAGVMIVWGVATNVLGFLLFKKRDF